MNNPKITALKNNNNLSLVLGTKHYHFTGEKSAPVFEAAMAYHKNPTDENLYELEDLISKFNSVLRAGIIQEAPNGKYYLNGHTSLEMPQKLAEQIIEYKENDYPVDALINFWKLCMANPNTQAREDFFQYINRFGITITDNGYAVLYKSVERKVEEDNSLINFVSQLYLKVKRWKKSPKNYEVIKTEDGYDYVDLKRNSIGSEESAGNLQKLYDSLDDLIEETNSYFTPHHKGGDYGNVIKLGEPVTMPREKCDPDITNACSYGLHIGARSYVKSFGWGNKIILAVLVNPMNIVALPKYDHSKIRCCEYFPYAVMAVDNEHWEEIESDYFEDDYCNYEKEHIDQLLESIQTNCAGLEPVNEKVIEETTNRLVYMYGDENVD